MPSESNISREMEVLRNIRQTAISMAKKLRNTGRVSKALSSPSNHPHPPIPPIAFPSPDDLLSPILELNIPERSREVILQSFHRRIRELQQQYSTTYKKACLSTSNGSTSHSDFEAIGRAYQAYYRRHCLPVIADQVSSVVGRAVMVQQRRQQHSSSLGKPAFNNQYTPFLEQYFAQNAYPSTADRLALAKKTMMTPRQIEVWFQNHRNRAKKDGKPLKRSSSLGDPALFTEASASPQSSVKSKSIDSSTHELPTTPPAPCHTFNAPRPPHAFPTPFSSRHFYHAFPSRDGSLALSPTVWMRSPAVPGIESPMISIDELTSLFVSKLHLRETASKKPHDRKCSSSFPMQAWFSSRITIPSSAPLPALIRSAVTTLTTIQPTNVTRTGLASQSRKLSGLPRRAPTTFSAFSAPLPLLLSSTATSRASSFASTTSTRSRLPSSASISSIDEPATPSVIPDASSFAITNDDFGLLDELFGADSNSSSGNSFAHFEFPSNYMCKATALPALYDFNALLTFPTYVQAWS